MSYVLVPNGPCAMSLSNSEWYSQFGYKTNVRGVALAVATACACQSRANAPGCMCACSLARAWTTDRVIKLSLPSALPRLRICRVPFGFTTRHLCDRCRGWRIRDKLVCIYQHICQMRLRLTELGHMG